MFINQEKFVEFVTLEYFLEHPVYLARIGLLHGFRERTRESIPTYARPRRNRIVYLPIPNIFIPRAAAREKRECTRMKTKITRMKNVRGRMDGRKNTGPKGTSRYLRPSGMEGRSLFLSRAAADLQDDERCAPRDTKAVREALRRTTWQRGERERERAPSKPSSY